MNSENNKPEIDDVTGVPFKDHEWDDIRELDNPMPRWWLWTFYVCILISIAGWFLYPAWPTLTDHTKGYLGWTMHKELQEGQAEIMVRKASYLKKFRAIPLDKIEDNAKIYNFALAGGASAFKDNCATCHGTGGAGAKGYPNLNDDDWLWGGDVNTIYETIKYGIRSTHDDSRISAMPAFGKDGLLSQKQISDVTDYVLSLSSGTSTNGDGKQIFSDNCSACHGADAKGGREFGAPNLADAIWLFGSDKETVSRTIQNSRSGVMPHWVERLDDDTIRQLSLYVHSLGGGE